MSTWQPVPLDEIADLLGMFTARGQGLVRDSAIRAVTVASDDAGGLVVDVTDSRHGCWRMTLEGVQVRDAVALSDDEAAEQTLTWVLQRGTWEVHDSSRCIYGVGRPVHGRGTSDWRTLREQAASHLAADTSGILYAGTGGLLGYERVQITFTGARFERQVLDRAPGSCVACGGVEFTLRAEANVPVRATDDGGYRATATTADELADTVRLCNVFASLVCCSCGTKVDDGGFGNLDITLAGRQFDHHAAMKLADLLPSTPPTESDASTTR